MPVQDMNDRSAELRRRYTDPVERRFADWYDTHWHTLRSTAQRFAPENVALMDSVRGLVRNVAWEAYQQDRPFRAVLDRRDREVHDSRNTIEYFRNCLMFVETGRWKAETAIKRMRAWLDKYGDKDYR